jgi:hypothetical protein
MGFREIQAMNAARLGFLPEAGTYVPQKPSGPKKRKPIGANRAKDEKQKLEAWFAAIAKLEAGDCQCSECGTRIPDTFLRHATAHIFPKGDFPSVMYHPYNYVILGAHCCHDKSHRVDTFSKINIFREAVERFLEFDPLMTPGEKAKPFYTLFLHAAMTRFPQLFKNSYFVKPEFNA